MIFSLKVVGNDNGIPRGGREAFQYLDRRGFELKQLILENIVEHFRSP